MNDFFRFQRNKIIKLSATLLAAAMAVCVLGALAACSGRKGLNGVPIENYTVVYAAGDETGRKLAEQFIGAVETGTGISLPCVSDETADGGHEILFGTTNRVASSSESGAYTITEAGDSVLVGADKPAGMLAAAQKLLADIKAGGADYGANPVKGSYPDSSLRIMSFNIRTTAEDRLVRLAEVIRRNNPDLLGMQEVSTAWQQKLKAEFGGVYGSLGQGREGGEAGEASLIFYRKDMFEVIESGTKWYSSTPDTPSKYDDSGYLRVFTYALFERKSDGLEFLYLNTHLDLNKAPRVRAAEFINAFITENYYDVPLFITGDFNANSNYEGYADDLDTSDPAADASRKMLEFGYTDCRLDASASDGHWTYPSDLYYPNGGVKSGSIIDYCFVRGYGKRDILVDSYRVDIAPPETSYTIPNCGAAASDHYPIVIDTLLYTVLG